jgi:hypothetical protein
MLGYRDAWKYNWLVRVAKRVESDRERAIERGDTARALQHTNRVYSADAKLRGFLAAHVESFRS